ncbi:contractile injection system protein, VgrG/Pvc8 family [Escherichia coli]|nr:contractile injection system protein, VgrG/Pvc8 family [Escherichia coli]
MSVCSVMRRMSARHRCRARITPLRCRTGTGMYEQQGENLNGQLEQYEIFDYPGRYKDEQHGKDFTLYQMESLRSDAEKATGQSNSPKLW